VKIPDAERAVVDAAKVRDYLLSAEHRVGSAKARFFAQLGFDQQNWAILQGELVRFAEQEARLGAATRFGQKSVRPRDLDRSTSCRVRYKGRPGAVRNS